MLERAGRTNAAGGGLVAVEVDAPPDAKPTEKELVASMMPDDTRRPSKHSIQEVAA